MAANDKTELPQWRCPSCGNVLGEHRDLRVALKNQAGRFLVGGRARILAVCLRCKEPCELFIDAAAEAADDR